MAFSLRQNKPRLLAIRLTLWSTLLVVAAAIYLQARPVALESGLEFAEGQALDLERDADVLVVIDYEAVEESPDNFEERDFSAAWIELFERQVGPVSVATPESLSADKIDDARLLVITHSIARDMPEVLLERSREHALDGQAVLIDRPQGEARELFGADGGAGHRQGDQITYAADLDESFADDLAHMPLFVDYIGSTGPRDEATTLMAIDGAPVIYASRFGQGAVITVDFDLPRQLVALRQGRPQPDFGLAAPESDRHRSADLVADDDLLGADVPYADLLERFVVFGAIQPYAHIPALWPFPGNMRGAVVFVHGDDLLGDDGAWPLDHERRHQASSTLLTTFDSGLSEEGAESILDRDGQIGLNWRLAHSPDVPTRREGMAGFEPFHRPISLADQRSELSDILPYGSVRSARIHGGLWLDEWDAPWAALDAAGIRQDFSLIAPDHRGYAFGSGLPTRAINQQGLPLRLRTMPIVYPIGAQDGPELETLLADSEERYHQTITVLGDPSRFARQPRMDDFQRWLGYFDAIDRHHHWAPNAADLYEYLRQRRQTPMRSRLHRRVDLPDELASESSDPTASATLLRLTVEAPRPRMTLMIPPRIGDAQFVGALEGTERVGADIVTNVLSTEPVDYSGLTLRQTRLSRGFNNLELYYQ